MREAVNIAQFLAVDEMVMEDREFRYSGGKKPTDDPVETHIEHWEEKIGLKVDPDAEALKAYKAWRASQGLEWDDTPVQLDWRERDEEIPGEYIAGVQGAKGKGH